MPGTAFHPLNHGFHFSNFGYFRVIGTYLDGYCLGMVYAATDYFRNGAAVPLDTARPAAGTILADYILERHATGNLQTSPRFLRVFGATDAAPYFEAGLGNGPEFARLAESIGRSEPVPITLVPASGPPDGHCVLAIGCTSVVSWQVTADVARLHAAKGQSGRIGDVTTDATRVRIQVYDPNFPDETCVLTPTAEQRFLVSRASGWPAYSWKAYFVHNQFVTKTPVLPSTQKVALKAFNGKFVCAEGGGGGALFADRAQQGPWEVFVMEEQQDRQVALKAANGQYVTALDGGGGDVTASANAVGAWERFVPTHVLGKIALRTSNFRFVSVDRNNRLRADAISPLVPQLFETIDV